MFVKDLITQLEQLIQENEPYREMMGEAEITIDIFVPVPGSDLHFQYAGFSPHVRITKSSDGVYDILTAFADPNHHYET